MRKQRLQIEWCELPDETDCVFELPELLFEPVELPPPAGMRGCAREKDARSACLCVGRRPIRNCQNAAGLEVLAFRGVLNLALPVECGADRIRKRPDWIIGAWITDEVDVVHEAVVQTAE